MILSKLKLKKRDFDYIFIKKEINLLKIIRNNYFDLKIFKSNDFKVSVIISSKTESGAVNRNKIKRIFYFIIKKWINKNLDKKNYFIFYPKKEAFDAEFSFLEKELYNVLNNL